jgi:hypothetical protein
MGRNNNRLAYPPRNIRTDTSFGVRHPIPRGYDTIVDQYGLVMDRVHRIGEEYFGTVQSIKSSEPSRGSSPLMVSRELDVTSQAADDEIVIFPVSGAPSTPVLPFSALKLNGEPAINILSKKKVSDKKNRRAFGLTDRDLLRTQGDIERSLGRLMFLTDKPVKFDQVIVNRQTIPGAERIAKIALVPASPWLEYFAREQEIAHESVFRGNGRFEPFHGDPPHLDIIRMARSVSAAKTDGFAEAIAKGMGIITLPVGPLEFYDNSTIQITHRTPK